MDLFPPASAGYVPSSFGQKCEAGVRRGRRGAWQILAIGAVLSIVGLVDANTRPFPPSGYPGCDPFDFRWVLDVAVVGFGTVIAGVAVVAGSAFIGGPFGLARRHAKAHASEAELRQWMVDGRLDRSGFHRLEASRQDFLGARFPGADLAIASRALFRVGAIGLLVSVTAVAVLVDEMTYGYNGCWRYDDVALLVPAGVLMVVSLACVVGWIGIRRESKRARDAASAAVRGLEADLIAQDRPRREAVAASGPAPSFNLYQGRG